MAEELPEHVRRNRAQWDLWASEYAEPGQRNWAQEPSWGLFGVPESQLHVLPDLPDAHATDRLVRPLSGLHRMEWSDDDSMEFHLPHGETTALLRRCGLQVEELLENRPPDGSTTRYPFMTLEWAQRWPCEEVWRARKPS